MVRLTERPDMTLDVYRGRKTTIQQQQQQRGINLPRYSVIRNSDHPDMLIAVYGHREPIQRGGVKLNVGSWGFEGTIILIILFSKLLESTFYKEINKFQQKV